MSMTNLWAVVYVVGAVAWLLGWVTTFLALYFNHTATWIDKTIVATGVLMLWPLVAVLLMIHDHLRRQQ